MSLSNFIKSKVAFACLVAFIFTSCASGSGFKTKDLYFICKVRYEWDHGISLTQDQKKLLRKVTDPELKKRGKDCGCYYQAWSPIYLSMGLIGMGLMSSSSSHCKNDQPAAVK